MANEDIVHALVIAGHAAQLLPQVKQIVIADLDRYGSFIEPSDMTAFRALATQDLPLRHILKRVEAFAIVDVERLDAVALESKVWARGL